MSCVAILPARGGSRRIPRKNIKLFHGKPIIYYSIKAAQDSGLFDAIYVSTDDAEIASVAKQCGARYMDRTEEFARDEVGTQEIMRQAMLYFDGVSSGPRYEYACCIYPCSPMLDEEDLRFAYNRLLGWPQFNYVKIDGWYYFGKAKAFLDNEPIDDAKSVLSVFPDAERWIDINTPEDWSKAEAMYAALHK